MVCAAMVSAFTGANVPRPTCNVRKSTSTPRVERSASSASVKCSPAVGAATEPGWLSLALLSHPVRVSAHNVGRQRDLAEDIEQVGDVGCAREAQPPMAFSIRVEHCGLNVSRLSARVSENDLSARARAFARAQHGPPIVECVFFEQQDLEPSARARIRAAKSGRDYARVVED